MQYTVRPFSKALLKYQQLFAKHQQPQISAQPHGAEILTALDIHKQAVSGPRRARLPKRDADSWQGVATS